MDDVLAVRVVERVGHLAGEPERPAERDPPLGDELVAQGAALDVWGDVVEEPVGFARVVERQQMGMVEPRGDPDLPEEALGAEHFGKPSLQHLERDHPVVPEIAREIDHGHSAVAHLALDRIAAGQGGLQLVEEVEHAVIPAISLARIPPGRRHGQTARVIPRNGRRVVARPVHLQARIAAASTAGTLAQLARSSSAVTRAMSECALRWLSE